MKPIIKGRMTKQPIALPRSMPQHILQSFQVTVSAVNSWGFKSIVMANLPKAAQGFIRAMTRDAAPLRCQSGGQYPRSLIELQNSASSTCPPPRQRDMKKPRKIQEANDIVGVIGMAFIERRRHHFAKASACSIVRPSA